MSEAGTEQSWGWYGAVGGVVIGAVLVLTLLVQNVLQGREITALETDVAALQTSIVEARRAAGLSAIGSLSSASASPKARPKRAKARSGAGAAREGKSRGAKAAEGGTRTAKAQRVVPGSQPGKSRGAPAEPTATP